VVEVNKDLSIILPCFNEEFNIFTLSNAIIKVVNEMDINAEIIFVNDASVDNTEKEILKIQKKINKIDIKYFKHERNLGIFAAWKTGINKSYGNVVCFIDSDLQNPPSEIKNLYRELINSQADMVQGSRSTVSREPDIRYYLSISLNFILNFLFSIKSKDNKSGFFVTYRDCINDILNYKFKYFFPHTFCRVSAEYRGYDVFEIETLFEERKMGQSFLKDFPVLAIIKSLYDIFLAFYEFRFLTRKKNDLDRFLELNPPRKEPNTKSFFNLIFWRLYVLLTPFHKWMISSNFAKIYESLNRTQYLKNSDLKKIQLFKLKKLIRHCYSQVPYYREIFDKNNLKPSDIQNLNDLKKIPVLNKEDVRKNIYFNLFAKNHKKKEMLKVVTSGSTGQPFITYADKKQLEIRFATTIRAAEWTGYKFGDRQVRLWHQTIGMSITQVIKEKVDALFMKRLFIPAFEMTPDKLKLFFKKIKRHDPVLIDGYAESFNFLSQYLENYPDSKLKIMSAMTSAQILPEQVREIIETNLNCKVYDKYGSREFSGIAYEDKSFSGHLVQMESYIVELIRNNTDAQPGEDGEVIITDLNNFHFPLLRYRIGDIAEAIDNSNLEQFDIQMDRIGKIKGRTQALVFCKNGRWLPGTFFYHFFKDYSDFINQFQIIQDIPGEFTLKIVKNNLYNEAAKEKILTDLKNHIGKETIVKLQIVEEINLVKTGKRTPVISNVKIDFQNL
jgi:phenylacetate-CoA ligase